MKVNRPERPRRSAIIKQGYDPGRSPSSTRVATGRVRGLREPHPLRSRRTSRSSQQGDGPRAEPGGEGQIAWFVAPGSGAEAPGRRQAHRDDPPRPATTSRRTTTSASPRRRSRSTLAPRPGRRPHADGPSPPTLADGPRRHGRGPATRTPSPSIRRPAAAARTKLCCPDQGCIDGALLRLELEQVVAWPGSARRSATGRSTSRSTRGTFCSAGTRLDSSKSQCVACGDLETFCYATRTTSINQGVLQRRHALRLEQIAADRRDAAVKARRFCCCKDPDHVSINQGRPATPPARFDSSKSRCVACSGEGLTFCYVDPNGVSGNSGTRCDAGLRIRGSVCVK